MKLPERLARRKGRGFHSALATTFAVEFAAFEEVMLPQLAAGGATNVLLVADGRMATMALSDGSSLPEALGREYVMHAPPAAEGVFHPKIILQVGREGGRCIVSSANVTGAGLGGNVEVTVEIECGGEPSAERALVKAAWRYLDALVPADAGAARESISWARERARWLDEADEGDGLHVLDDGTAMAFIARPGGAGIGARFAGLVGGEPVERLVILSPYWDGSLEAVGALERTLSPARTSLLIDVDRHELPGKAPMPPGRDVIDISEWRPSRFTHAKIMIAITSDHDHVLSGSANCTIAAIGDEAFAGTNAEACVYRRLPRGAATAALALDDWLAAEPFPLGDLPEPVDATPIPLKEMQAGGPGSFETEGGRLGWRRPAGRWNDGLVILSKASGEVLVEIDVARFAADGDRLSVWIGDEVLADAAFARVRTGDAESLLGYVVQRAALRSRRRETVGGSVARALSAFDDGNEMHLRLLQAFDELARADTEDDGETVGAGSARQKSRPATEESAPEERFLTYEQFMSARSAGRGRRGRCDSSVSGTHFDSVRALLNRLSGGGRSGPSGSAPDDDDTWMNLADETGEMSDGPDSPPGDKDDEPVVRPAPDLGAYDRAIKAYSDGLHAEGRAIGARDVLRLRLWITLILWEARCDAAPNGLLAVTDEKGWPRLLIRILSAFFWGKNSPVSRLVVSDDYDDMPVDFFECWSTVLWSLDAIVAAVLDQPRNRDFLRRMPTLRAHVVTMLGLTATDLSGELMTKQRQGLDADLGVRFGLISTKPDYKRVATLGKRSAGLTA